MSLPPAFIDVAWAGPGSKPHRLWLPLFLLWPLALALGLIALVFTALADVVLLIAGQRYHHYTILLARSFLALNETRGMVLRIHSDGTTVDLTVR
jgi:hypothetical protein